MQEVSSTEDRISLRASTDAKDEGKDEKNAEDVCLFLSIMKWRALSFFFLRHAGSDGIYNRKIELIR